MMNKQFLIKSLITVKMTIIILANNKNNKKLIPAIINNKQPLIPLITPNNNHTPN